MKKTRAPAPQISLIEQDSAAVAEAEAAGGMEVDTTEEADIASANAPVPPPFQHDEGEQTAVMVDSAEDFVKAGFQTPDWRDEQATESELAAADSDATEGELEAAMVETGADAMDDAVDMEMDEMAMNERAAQQVDMDATSDEAANAHAHALADADEEVTQTEVIEEVDSDEASSDAEADSAEEEVDEEEAVDDAEAAEASSFVETDASAEDDSEEVDALLSEVDSNLESEDESEAEDDSEAESEGEADSEDKGTPGHSISAGQTWEEAQNERLNRLQQRLEAERAATPKVAAAVVGSKAELSAVDSDHQTPAYNTESDAVETVAPEIVA